METCLKERRKLAGGENLLQMKKAEDSDVHSPNFFFEN
jgi:hypothetical protein